VVHEIDARWPSEQVRRDAVLAVFGGPVRALDHFAMVLARARAIAGRLPEEMAEAVAGIGVATGRVVAGNVGDRKRIEYTVIDDPLNQAVRLTELAKQWPGRLLAPAVMSRRPIGRRRHTGPVGHGDTSASR
jgi:class 3 adenylate cyclase